MVHPLVRCSCRSHTGEGIQENNPGRKHYKLPRLPISARWPWDDPLVAVPSRGIFLEFVQSSLVEGSGVPLGIGEEPVEAGLVRGLGEFPVDTEHRLTLRHHQSSEVLSEVSPLAFVGKETTVLGQGVLHDLGKPDDSWHEQMLRSPFAPGEKWSKPAPSSPFLHKLP